MYGTQYIQDIPRAHPARRKQEDRERRALRELRTTQACIPVDAACRELRVDVRSFHRRARVEKCETACHHEARSDRLTRLPGESGSVVRN